MGRRPRRRNYSLGKQAVVAKNATTEFQRNMQKMHIAVSKKATVSKWETVRGLRSTRMDRETAWQLPMITRLLNFRSCA
jgi:hypothetical protein